jgi:hypothetical protein
MQNNPAVKEILLVLINRYHADRRAQSSYADERARKIATVTLDAFISNVETELRERFGLTLEGIGADNDA